MRFTSGRTFVDTNVWCYGIQNNDLAKHEIANKILRELSEHDELLFRLRS